jgi:hypothetical protein
MFWYLRFNRPPKGGLRVSTMAAPREVANRARAGRESDNAHAQYATAKHYSYLTYTDPLQVTHMLCVCACN